MIKLTSIAETARAALAPYRFLIAFAAFSAITIAIFVPLRPSFPVGTQLDNSWVTGLNEAVSLNLAFGRDVVFTFGPYASVYTHEYHRATDSLMLFGGGLLALGFATVLSAIGSIRGFALPMLIATALLILFNQKDALLFTYPLLAAIYVHLRYLVNAPQALQPANSLLLGLIFLPFGLLPLVKGSALVMCAATAALCSAALAFQGKRREALVCLVVPVASCVFLWLAAGQDLQYLPVFLWNLVPIVIGFAPAMSSEGPVTEILLFLVGAAVVLGRTLRLPDSRIRDAAFVTTAFALFLFLAFKAGFVRHDGHALTAAAAIGIAGIAVSLPLRSAATLTGIVCLGVWAYLDAGYANTSTRAFVDRATKPFLALRDGAVLRWHGGRDELDAITKGQRVALAKECPLDKLDGPSDIYSYRQACLIFSDNAWSPRPIFQSYSAYTPRLAWLNARHLIGDRAPKHVLFRVEPIDGRLPSLEDGPSWPLLLSRYEPRRVDGDLAYLQLRAGAPPGALPGFYGDVYRARLGESVVVPKHSGALMAQIDLRPTLLGRLTSVAFKTPVPRVRLTLASGAERSYRLVPGMAAAGFLLSPHVTATRDFVLLHEGHVDALSASNVRSFRIELSPLGEWFWSSDFSVRYEEVAYAPATTQVARTLFDEVLAVPPLGGKVSATEVCAGSIDRMNGVSPVPMTVTSGPIIALDGWTAVSPKTGDLPDKVYVVVKDGNGRYAYFLARSVPRPDVRDYFKQGGLLNSGFEAYIDASSLDGGSLQIFIAHERRGRLVHCEPFRSLTIAR